MKYTLIIFFLAALFSGCATQPVNIATLPGEIRYTPQDAVAVRLDSSFTNRVEHIHGPFGEEGWTKLITDSVWRRVFVGYKDEQPVLSIASSELREAPEVIGFTTRYTYTANLVLHFDQHEIPLAVSGSRASGLLLGSAMRQAVELAVVDASHQVRAIIEANKK